MLKKVQAGDPLRIPAPTWNLLVQMADEWQRERLGGGRGRGPADTGAQFVLVKNASGTDRARFDILGVDAPIILPSANLDEFKSRVALAGVTPAAGTHEGRFVILLEPLADGAIGRACVAGVCPARVDVTDEDHGFAEIADGEAGCLESAESGSAVILWKESGEGEKWALVKLAVGPGGAGQWYWFDRHLTFQDEQESGRFLPLGVTAELQWENSYFPVSAGKARRIIAHCWAGIITQGTVTIKTVRKSRSEQAPCPDVDTVLDTPALVFTGSSCTGQTIADSVAFASEDLLGCAWAVDGLDEFYTLNIRVGIYYEMT